MRREGGTSSSLRDASNMCVVICYSTVKFFYPSVAAQSQTLSSLFENVFSKLVSGFSRGDRYVLGFAEYRDGPHWLVNVITITLCTACQKRYRTVNQQSKYEHPVKF